MAYIPPRIAIYSLMIGCVIVKQVKISDMKISELIKKLQEIQKERNCELDAINSLGDEIVEVKCLYFSNSVVFMTDEDL